MVLLRKKESSYFELLKDKYEDEYEELQLLILMLFVKIATIILKVLNFEFINFLNSIVLYFFLLTRLRNKLLAVWSHFMR
jgi:hypothetical protein